MYFFTIENGNRSQKSGAQALASHCLSSASRCGASMLYTI